MITVQNLVKFYGTNLAVNCLSFQVNDGEIVALLGPNGAGKTTVLRSITGVIQKSAGKVIVDGFDQDVHEQEIKRRIAFVPEVPSPFEMLTVEEHLRFIAMAYGTTENFESRSAELIERFELTEKRRELVVSLSKGMRQKLAIACAFIHNARNFLFDEPLIGIDPLGVKTLKHLMLEARDQWCAILISTHMLDTAEKLCDRILILRKGIKLAEGTLNELYNRAKVRKDGSLEDVFLTLTEEEKSIEGSCLPGI